MLQDQLVIKWLKSFVVQVSRLFINCIFPVPEFNQGFTVLGV
jgi:hypothetical protein